MKMTKIQNSVEKIKSMINEKSTDEEIKSFQEIANNLESAMKDEEELAKKYDGLRSKYVEMIKNYSFPSNEEVKEENNSCDLETIIRNVVKKEK